MAKKQVTKRRKFQIPINRFCRFTKAGVKEIDYKDVDTLLKNIDEKWKDNTIKNNWYLCQISASVNYCD